MAKAPNANPNPGNPHPNPNPGQDPFHGHKVPSDWILPNGQPNPAAAGRPNREGKASEERRKATGRRFVRKGERDVPS